MASRHQDRFNEGKRDVELARWCCARPTCRFPSAPSHTAPRASASPLTSSSILVNTRTRAELDDMLADGNRFTSRALAEGVDLL